MAAQGSAVITEETYGSVKSVKWVWVAGTGGTVLQACTTTAFYSGQVLFFVTVPSGGATAPTDNYDCTIIDKNGVDILADAGMNRDTASTESILAASLGTCANSQLELNVSAAGSAGKGTVYLWLR